MDDQQSYSSCNSPTRDIRVLKNKYTLLHYKGQDAIIESLASPSCHNRAHTSTVLMGETIRNLEEWAKSELTGNISRHFEDCE